MSNRSYLYFSLHLNTGHISYFLSVWLNISLKCTVNYKRLYFMILKKYWTTVATKKWLCFMNELQEKTDDEPGKEKRSREMNNTPHQGSSSLWCVYSVCSVHTCCVSVASGFNVLSAASGRFSVESTRNVDSYRVCWGLFHRWEKKRNCTDECRRRSGHTKS